MILHTLNVTFSLVCKYVCIYFSVPDCRGRDQIINFEKNNPPIRLMKIMEYFYPLGQFIRPPPLYN